MLEIQMYTLDFIDMMNQYHVHLLDIAKEGKFPKSLSWRQNDHGETVSF